MNEFYKEIFSQRNKALERCKLYKDIDVPKCLKCLQYYKIDLYSQLLCIAFKNISKPDELPEEFSIHSEYFDEIFIKYLLEEINISANIHTTFSSLFPKCFKVSLINTSFKTEDQTSIENNILEGLISIRNWYIEYFKSPDKYNNKNVIDIFARLLGLTFTNYSNPDQFPESFYFDDVGINFSDFYFYIKKALEFTKNSDIIPNVEIIHAWSYKAGIPAHSFDYLVKLENKKKA